MACFSQRSLALLAVSSFAVMGLAGCGAISSPLPPQNVAAARLSGKIFGGQQPIAGSTVTVWQMGSTDYGSAATQLAQVQSGSDGSFSFAAGAYNCPTPTTQVYITAQGGEATPGYNNPAILLAAGLGNCSAAQGQAVNINEVTTAATAYALNQFFTYPLPSGDSFGSPEDALPSLTLSNASTIPMLVNLATGTVNPSTSSITIEAAKINSLANTLAACVNSTAATSFTCSTLFADTTDTFGNTPANTLEAAVQMVEEPSRNITDLYDLGTPTAPFAGLSNAPNDWSLAVSYTTPNMGLGIVTTANSATSSTIDIDAAGRVWFPSNLPGSTGIGNFDPSTTTFNGPYVTGALTQPQYVTIDSTGLAWVTDVVTPTIGYADTAAPTTNIFFATAPAGILSLGPVVAADDTGDIFFAYTDSNNVPSLAEANGDGDGGQLGAFTNFPTGMVSPGFGAYAATSGLATPCAGEGMAEDTPTFDDLIFIESTGNCTSGGAAIAANNNDGLIVATSLNQICSVVAGSCFTPAPLNLPEGIATDGYGEEWIANSGNGSITTFGSINDSTPYDQISPVAYLHDATHGATMTAPYGIAIDGSGNVWTANASCVSATTTACTPTAFQLSELIGAAGPTITPLVAQNGGEYTGEEPNLAGHPTTLARHPSSQSLTPYVGSSAWSRGSARSSAQSSGSSTQNSSSPALRSNKGFPWLTR